MDKKEPKMVITTDKKRRVSWPHKNGSTNETIPCYSNFETNLRNTKTGSKMACPSVPFYWDFHLLYYLLESILSKLMWKAIARKSVGIDWMWRMVCGVSHVEARQLLAKRRGGHCCGSRQQKRDFFYTYLSWLLLEAMTSLPSYHTSKRKPLQLLFLYGRKPEVIMLRCLFSFCAYKWC